MPLADIRVRTCVQEESSLERIAQNSLASLWGTGYASSLSLAMQTVITIALYLIGSS